MSIGWIIIVMDGRVCFFSIYFVRYSMFSADERLLMYYLYSMEQCHSWNGCSLV
jgi:hypothetical protein